MTFTSIASKPILSTDSDRPIFKTAKLSKISVAGSITAIVGMTIFQNLMWMSVSSPSELPTPHKSAVVKTVK
ncbi:hypothetical protein [Chamaesiphon sp. OTE_75_metabat_556]|jgi:hypothetical protein|uniref:hypothetical protein n=1 Tax=Chamaesiphon sp. OTE_75_metabat_556 TaxID=2964692 RepID=UPI00286A303C|nr:hypothetical protein [Chamaesiphon sp. OTE_75_metabat_556]